MGTRTPLEGCDRYRQPRLKPKAKRYCRTDERGLVLEARERAVRKFDRS